MFTQLLNTDHLQRPTLDQLANQFSRLVTTVNSSISSWVHMILRKASFSVGLVAACRWPIVDRMVH